MEAESDLVSLPLSASRRDLLEVLDRLVVHQQYYHSVYGHYTKVLSRVGFTIPHRVARQYEVRVAEASKTHLLVTAFSEENGKMVDMASINQSFKLETNFPVPPPRREYLKLHAYKHLRLLRGAIPGQSVHEEGVFNGYFRYEVRRDSEGRPIAFGMGIRPPVLGMQIEAGDSRDPLMTQDSEAHLQLLTSLMNSASDWEVPSTGQNPDRTVMSSNEEAFLAQQIFHGEMGRYARDWSELARVTHFRFDDGADRRPGSVGGAQNDGPVQPKQNNSLVIEPIDPAPKQSKQ